MIIEDAFYGNKSLKAPLCILSYLNTLNALQGWLKSQIARISEWK